MKIIKTLALATATAATICIASIASAATFSFTETSGGVEMTSSGSIDVSGLVLQNDVSDWGGIGVETNNAPGTDIMGNTTAAGGGLDRTYSFNVGTDESAWFGPNGPFSNSFFGFTLTSGTKNFTTYDISTGVRKAGLGLFSGDLFGSIWTPDNTWFVGSSSFASLGLITGTYTVTDALSGQSLSIVVGGIAAVPLPATLPLQLAALGFGFFRFRRNA